MPNLSNYAETEVLEWLMTAVAITRPTAWHLALHTGDPTETGGSNEVAGNGYARQSATFTVTGDSATNDAQETFTASGGNWGEILGVSIWDAATSGNALWRGFLGQEALQPFTAATDDFFTCPGHGFSDTQQVILEDAFGGLPTGVTARTRYYVRDSTTNTFKLATTSGGTAIDITAVGEGLVARINPKTINDGDSLVFAAGAVDLFLN